MGDLLRLSLGWRSIVIIVVLAGILQTPFGQIMDDQRFRIRRQLQYQNISSSTIPILGGSNAVNSSLGESSTSSTFSTLSALSVLSGLLTSSELATIALTPYYETASGAPRATDHAKSESLTGPGRAPSIAYSRSSLLSGVTGIASRYSPIQPFPTSNQTVWPTNQGKPMPTGTSGSCSGTTILSCFDENIVTSISAVFASNKTRASGKNSTHPRSTVLPFCETIAAFRTIDPPVTCTTTITVTIPRASPVVPTKQPMPESHSHHFHCAGTRTDDGLETVTTTSTTTVASGTITLAPGDRGPRGLFIRPLPFCFTIFACADGAQVCSVALKPAEAQTSTLLVTLKTPATIVRADTVSQLFPTVAKPGPVLSALSHQRSIVTIPPPVHTKSTEVPSTSTHEEQGVTPYGNAGPGTSPDVGSPLQSSGDDRGPAPPTGTGNSQNHPPYQDQPSSSGDTKPPSGANQPQEHGGSSGNTDDHGGAGASAPYNEGSTDQLSAPGGQGTSGNYQSPHGPKGSPQTSGLRGSEGSSESGDVPLPPAEILFPIQTIIHGIPVSIGSDGGNIGGHYVHAGSPKSTMVVDGHTITVEQSRIVAEGTTLPIPQLHESPQTDATIAGVPIHLEAGKLVVAGKTYTPGSQPSTFVHGSHTFRLSGSQISEGETTLNIPSAHPSPYHMNAGGQAFTLYPSQVEAPGIVVAIPHNGKASQFAYKGQTFEINPSQLAATARTVPVPHQARYTPFVYGSRTYSVGDNVIVGPTSTAQIHGGKGSIIYGGQTLYLQDGLVLGPSTTIDLSGFGDSPGGSAAPSRTVVDGVAISVGPNAAIIGTKTYSFIAGQSLTSIVNQGHTFGLSAHGIAVDGTELTIPTPTHTFSTITEGDLTFSVAPSEVVISDKTYHIGPKTPSFTTVINGQRISIGPSGVGMSGTTETFPASVIAATPTYTNGYEVISTDGIVFSLSPTEAIINGKMYAIGNGATAATTIVAGTKTISLGPDGIGLPGATVTPPAQMPKVVTDDGIILTMGSTDVIIDGKTYSIGPGASKTTLMVGGQRISLGPGGVGLESTTLTPLSSTSALASVTDAKAVTLPSNTDVITLPTRDAKSGSRALRYDLKSNQSWVGWLATAVGYLVAGTWF